MWSVVLVCGLALADTAEDTAVEDTAVEDTAVEDTAGDTAAIEDTSTLDDDTADTADTSSTDTGSTDTGTDSSTDTSDTSELITPASSLAGEKGGYGCATVGVGGAIAIWIASFAIGFRREQETL